MKSSPTLFLKAIIYLFGLAVAAFCLVILYGIFFGNFGMFLPLLFVILVTAVPFLFALYQGLLLLTYIDSNTAFSEQSVIAIKNIKYCAYIISVIYTLAIPYAFYVFDKDDAPGGILINLILIFAPLVTAVFAAVLQRLLQNAIDIKSENDLTV
jgi:hypothetical protein